SSPGRRPRVSTRASPRLVATVANTLGLKATQSFTVTGLSACPSAFWAATSAMFSTRVSHTAVLLGNGKVLVSGGRNNISGHMASSELYDPSTSSWSSSGSMYSPRYQHTATLLANGKVLALGGYFALESNSELRA